MIITSGLAETSTHSLLKVGVYKDILAELLISLCQKITCTVPIVILVVIALKFDQHIFVATELDFIGKSEIFNSSLQKILDHWRYQPGIGPTLFCFLSQNLARHI